MKTPLIIDYREKRIETKGFYFLDSGTALRIDTHYELYCKVGRRVDESIKCKD
jgi:hypothetical protein